ncbi:MAG TPA: hypothetical protein VGF14_02965 [Alphaproteobacteria bacterium]
MENTKENQEIVVDFAVAQSNVKKMLEIIHLSGDATTMDYYKTTMAHLTKTWDSNVDQLKNKVIVVASILERLPVTLQSYEGVAAVHTAFREGLFDVAKGDGQIGAEPSPGQRVWGFMQEGAVKARNFFGKVGDKVAALDL